MSEVYMQVNTHCACRSTQLETLPMSVEDSRWLLLQAEVKLWKTMRSYKQELDQKGEAN